MSHLASVMRTEGVFAGRSDHTDERASHVKMSFLSKWTVLLLTVISIAFTVVGVLLTQGSFGASNVGLAIILFVVAAIVYAIAWFVGLFDSIQERRWGWTVALIILLPVWIGPLLYSLIGPRNTK
jgi:hypothetical protein